MTRCTCDKPNPLHFPAEPDVGIMQGQTWCLECDCLIETDAEREAAREDAREAEATGN